VGDAIVSATGDLFDDFAVVRKIARVAIEAMHAGRGPGMKPDPAATRLLNLLVAIGGDRINSYRPKISRRLWPPSTLMPG
jgi:hypothetical protein